MSASSPRASAIAVGDIFMNILTTNGYVARYVSDWVGPCARRTTSATGTVVVTLPSRP
jgi:hypothetical protein